MRLPFSLLPFARGFASLLPADRGSLDVDAIAAATPGGLDPALLGGQQVETPLRALMHAFAAEAELTKLGRLAARWDVDRCLTNLRQLHAAEEAHPEVLDEKIEAPIFIMGLPRSANTFLHRVLAEDPVHQILRCWQAIYPYPFADQRPGAEDERPRRFDRQLKIFDLLVPEMRSVHPMDAWSPQECTEITAQVFQSVRFDSTHHIPSYRRWLNEHGHEAAYRFHKRYLQHLQHQAGPAPAGGWRWVLKSPDHLFAVDALRRVYPDARIVFMHRDPLKVLASVARLTEILRIPFARRADRHEIGAQIMGDWLAGAARMIEIASDTRYPRPLDLHYFDVVSQPLDAVRRLYRHFDVPLAPVAVERMTRMVGAKPDGGYGHNTYDLRAYGIDPTGVRQHFRDYMSFFAVAEEAPDAAVTARRRQESLAFPARSPHQA
jgi:hypothetical protein